MNKNILEDTIDHISLEAVNNSSTNIIPSGTPIIATRMSLGKIVVAKFDSAINQDLKALFLPASISSNYLVYWYRSIARQIEELGTGTTVKGIRLENLKALEFPVAPLAEQKAIADKLDTLLAQVESTKARLERVPQILKRFRQSVLAAAVSGKLTEDWRESEGLPFPKSICVDEISELVTKGASPKWQGINYVDDSSQTMFVTSENVGVFDLLLDEPKFVEDSFNEKQKRSVLQFGDVLTNIVGASIGRAAIWDRTDKANTNQAVCIIRPDITKCLSKYLCFYLNSPNGVEQLLGNKVDVARANVSLGNIKDLQLSLPSIEEQTEIVRRVEQLFAYAGTIEQQVQNALARVNNLTQSILAKAFRGKLTEQWRKDNPDLISGDNSAEALLEKIKAERKALAKQPQKSKATVKQKTGNTMSKGIIKVTEALRAANKPLTGQELMAAAGYPSNSSTEQLEQFFLDVRDALETKQIIMQKRNEHGQDWFSLNEATES